MVHFSNGWALAMAVAIVPTIQKPDRIQVCLNLIQSVILTIQCYINILECAQILCVRDPKICLSYQHYKE